MPEGGADIGIGPLPRWAARYLLTGDIRAYHGVLANGDAGGTYSTHSRKQATDYPPSIDDHPRMGNNSPNGPDRPAQCTEQGTDDATWTCRNSYIADGAHQPSTAYLPYIITGDHFYLEELTFWANYNFIRMGYSTREEELGLLKGQQVRTTAWALRTLGHAAYILPDEHQMKDYFNEKLANNRTWLMEMYVNNSDANSLGAARPRSNLEGKPWMDDFFTWSIGYLVELGFTDFIPILQWKAKYPLQRMSLQDSGYCWIFGAAYTHGLGPDPTAWAGNPDNWFQTLAQVYQATFTNNYWMMPGDPDNRLIDKPCGSTEMAAWLTTRFDRPYAIGEMFGAASSSMGYPANLQPALAVLVDAGITDSNAAWTRLITSASRPNYSSTPQFALAPRLLDMPDLIFANSFEK